MKKKCVVRKYLVTAAAVLLFLMQTIPAYAYFDRGTVSVSLGQSEVDLTSGDGANVTVSFSPSSSDQLPGCGMPECPQSCGEKNCLDANNNCTCGGTTYSTYYTTADVSSSDTSVASASYDGSGNIAVHANGPGSAVITVTASLRQYTSSSASMTVNVAESSQQNGNAGDESNDTGVQASDGSGTGTATIVVGNNDTASSQTADGGDQTSAGAASSAAQGQGSSVINSDKGKITFQEIKDGPMGSDLFKEIMGKKEYADFQKKDASGNILYSWEFCGTDVTSDDDLDMNITVSKTAGGSVMEAAGGADALYLSFAASGTFPGKAVINLRVSDYYQNGDKLTLYYYNPDTKKAELVSSDLEVVNGYVTIEISHASDYFMTNGEIAAKTGGSLIWKALAVLAVLAAVLAAVLVVMHKRRTAEETEKK